MFNLRRVIRLCPAFTVVAALLAGSASQSYAETGTVSENHQGRVYRWCRWWLRHFDIPGQAISAEYRWR
jgi:hypothetical protein